MPQTPDFPYQDGDVTVLGPQIFASKDDTVISWKGENYVRHTEQDRAPSDLTPDALYELASAVRDLASAVRLERADRTITVTADGSLNPADIASEVTSTLRKMRRRPEGGA